MRFWGLVFAVLTALPAYAQENAAATQIQSKCGPVAAKIGNVEPFSRARLFIQYQSEWEEVAPSFFGADFTLEKYSGGRIRFIYVVPPSDQRQRQFLSIRTTADTLDEDTFVNLRRQHSQFDTIHFGAYNGYHSNGEPSAMMRRFHRWPDGDRSDEPKETREAWAFRTRTELARRRVLSIPYRATDQAFCVPFIIGPNIATPAEQSDGEDEITILKGFVVEIAEAKTASRSMGRTFTIRSPVTKVP